MNRADVGVLSLAAGIVLGALLALLLSGCRDPLTPADELEIAADAVAIERCQALGRACKADGGADCYGVYDACMRDAGLR